MWLLRDPWELSQRTLIFPQVLAQVLHLCDGTRTLQVLHRDFVRFVGEDIPFEVIRDVIAALDQALLFDNDNARLAATKMVEGYRAQSFRPAALAGLGYPADPGELSRLLAQYGDGDEPDGWPQWTGRGIVSPHIDYPRGGPVYARVWRRAAPGVLSADLVIIIGTDHNGSAGSITLTHLPYATPYGVLPTDPEVVDRLALACGTDAAFAEELNHRREHSVELSAVWLHAIFHQAKVPPCPVVPILTGSFYHFVASGSHPRDDPKIQRFLDAVRRETHGRRVVIVASVDLAHVGPQFGDSFTMDEARRDVLRRADKALVASIVDGDAEGFYRQIAEVKDRNRICGFSPLYYMLSLLGATTGRLVGYNQCPADPDDTSLVSICGLLLD